MTSYRCPAYIRLLIVYLDIANDARADTTVAILEIFEESSLDKGTKKMDVFRATFEIKNGCV
jgi:hypothetical protein